MSYLPVIEPFSHRSTLANNLAQDVEDNLRRFFRDKEGFSPNTLKSLFFVVKSYANWCLKRGYPWLPVEAEHCREYLFWLKDNRGRAITTISHHLAMLNMLMDIAGLPKLTGDKTVSLGMKKLRRAAATSGERAGQAIPFHLTDLHAADRMYRQMQSAVGYRNRAFLFVAYNTMLRISEIGRIRVRDIEIRGDNVTLYVGYTKTNTVSETIKKLSPDTLKAVQDWLHISNLINQPDAILFSRVYKNGRVQVSDVPMSTRAIETIFKDTWIMMGRDDHGDNKGRYRQWSGHSCRVGATQDLNRTGASLPQIMVEGGWKNTETAMRYLRHSGAITSAVTEMMS